ncbi:MAG: hypothetical protein ABI824_08740 [Acidobacteriota bacterium]
MKLAILTLLPLLSAFPQNVFLDAKPTNQRDIAQRLDGSERIVVGRVTKSEVVHKLSKVAKMKAATPDTLSQILLDTQNDSGILLTVTVDTPLFDRSAPGRVGSGAAEIYFFQTLDEYDLSFDDRNPSESIGLGAKYLLFLRPDPRATQKVQDFGLAPDRKYYRTVERSRGAIRLEHDKYQIQYPYLKATAAKLTPEQIATSQTILNETNEFLATTTILCQALQPINVLEKLNRLETLKSPADPVLRQNADYLVNQLTGPDGRPKQ